MDITITREKENPLMMRKEVEGEVIHNSEATPSKEQIITYVSTKYHVGGEHIDLVYLVSRKGQNVAKFMVNIYNKPIKKGKEINEGEENGQA